MATPMRVGTSAGQQQGPHAAPPVSDVFTFDNTYARELQGFYVPWSPVRVPRPQLVCLNSKLADELGLGLETLDTERVAQMFAGNDVPDGAEPLAQAYAGHQFGGFSPQLGDGRALVLGEVVDRNGQRRDIALKGSGRTPFSRGGDGRAALGPMLREYLIGEAMHALGIPTTRALAVVRTGEDVERSTALPGAVLTRVAASHVRVGTFELFAARQEVEKVRVLADYVIARHYPDLIGSADRHLALLRVFAERQAALLAQWMSVGFIHGVLNTDNLALSGETFDYGPCAFMEAYDPKTVFSSIDTGGRYAYGRQPAVTQWNLARLAEALLPLFDAQSSDRALAQATDVVNGFTQLYETHWLTAVRAKLGLTTASPADATLASQWLTLLHAQQVDWTLAWRRLADAAAGRTEPLEALFPEVGALRLWLDRWRQRIAQEPDAALRRAEAMRRASPIYVPRNHRVEEVLAAASEHADLAPFERLLDVIARPYDERPDRHDHAVPAPPEATACYRTFCGT